MIDDQKTDIMSLNILEDSFLVEPYAYATFSLKFYIFA